jgi:hypothetical protein
MNANDKSGSINLEEGWIPVRKAIFYFAKYEINMK